jgi:hypothetical protein
MYYTLKEVTRTLSYRVSAAGEEYVFVSVLVKIKDDCFFFFSRGAPSVAHGIWKLQLWGVQGRYKD